jgi:hypothetical protein
MTSPRNRSFISAAIRVLTHPPPGLFSRWWTTQQTKHRRIAGKDQ